MSFVSKSVKSNIYITANKLPDSCTKCPLSIQHKGSHTWSCTLFNFRKKGVVPTKRDDKCELKVNKFYPYNGGRQL